MVQWAKRMLIGHGACWPDGLKTLAEPTGVQIQVWEGVFQHDWTSRHAMRLNSRTGIEGSPVPSLNCDRPLHSGIRTPGP